MDLDMQINLNEQLAVSKQSPSLRFDLFFKAYPRPIYVWQYQDGEFSLADTNDTGLEYLQDLTDFILQQDEDKLYPEGRGILADIKRCYQEKSRFKRVMPAFHLRSTGEVKDLIVTYSFVEPNSVLTIVKDVTDEQAMLNELTRLSNAVEQTADAVFITNRSGIIEYVNPAFEQVTGYSRTEVLGKTPRLLKSGEMTDEYYRKLWRTILGGEPFQGQTINRRRDGTKLIVEQTITPMKDQSGNVTHFVSLLKDMTYRIQFQEQETELRLAGKIQKVLYPKHSPKIDGYDIAGAVFPASNASGDCFDFINMLDETYGIVIGDVCGHGMGAALIMAETRAYLRSITRFVSDPRSILKELHNQIQADLIDTGFITMFLARLDPKRHYIQYANAGNWPVYIINTEGKVTHELGTNGYPIGISDTLELDPTETVPMSPGSMAVFLTDGIPEAMDASDTDFGIQRLLAIIQNYRSLPAGEIIQKVREEVLRFLGSIEPEDDQTIVICKRVQ